MIALTERQKTLIVNNVVRACKDSSKLNGTGYNFLYLCSGFIAHYNKFGFQSEYAPEGKLKRDILRNAEANMWRNFRPGERDYDYYASKAATYRMICGALDPRPN